MCSRQPFFRGEALQQYVRVERKPSNCVSWPHPSCCALAAALPPAGLRGVGLAGSGAHLRRASGALLDALPPGHQATNEWQTVLYTESSREHVIPLRKS
jgi:hypothetical protein